MQVTYKIERENSNSKKVHNSRISRENSNVENLKVTIFQRKNSNTKNLKIIRFTRENSKSNKVTDLRDRFHFVGRFSFIKSGNESELEKKV